jgi:hypothetical protein
MYRWLLALTFVAGSAAAQAPAATIDPGMTQKQVIEQLGKPAAIRTFQGSTYLLYSNKCGKSCGMQDLVILDHDSVVDAVFRSPDRHYSGNSSSPVATRPNARDSRSGTLAVPSSTPSAAEVVEPGTNHVPADSAKTSTSHVPADSAKTSTSHVPADSAMTPTGHAPAPVPYGKPSTTPPPADSAASSMSHPPVDNSTSTTSHPPTPPS